MFLMKVGDVIPVDLNQQEEIVYWVLVSNRFYIQHVSTFFWERFAHVMRSFRPIQTHHEEYSPASD